MATNYSGQLSEVSSKLGYIVSELEEISAGVRNNLDGIGNDICAGTLEAMVENYKDIKRKVDNVTESELEHCRKQEEG